MQSSLSRNLFAAAGVAAFLAGNVACATVIATFDDLPAPPALVSSTSLQLANNNSLSYQGITWDGFDVVGDEHRVDTVTPGPFYGKPHSGHYFVTNQSGADGLLITTDMVLTGAWFGPNEYFGFGRGADAITIVALSGAIELGSVTHALDPVDNGQTAPLEFVDTSAFLGLNGITGYRIDRHTPTQFQTNWVADDFQFESAQAPTPTTLALSGIGLVALLGVRRRRAGSPR